MERADMEGLEVCRNVVSSQSEGQDALGSSSFLLTVISVSVAVRKFETPDVRRAPTCHAISAHTVHVLSSTAHARGQ